MATEAYENPDVNKKEPLPVSLKERLLSKLRSKECKKFAISHVLPFITFFFLAIFIFRKTIGVNGVIIQGDFIYSPELGKFSQYFYPMWDGNIGLSALQRLPRLLFYLPFIAIATLFNMDTTEMMIMVFVFCELLAGVSMYYSSGYLLRKTYGDNNKVIIASFLAGLSYMWSFFLLYNFTYPHHRFAFALAPILILSLMVGLEKNKARYVVLTGFLWCLACADLHWTVHGGILLFSFILFHFGLEFIKLLPNGLLKALKKSIIAHSKHSIILVGSFISFSFYWFLPGLLMGGTSRYSAIIYAETPERLYSQSTILNLISRQAAHMSFQTEIIVNPTPELYSSSVMQNIMIILGLAVFVFGMSALIMKPKNRYVVFFSIFTIIAIFLASLPVLSLELYYWFIYDAPLHEWYGWDFKWPVISGLVMLSLAFLLGFSMFETLERVEKIRLRNINLKKGMTVSIIIVLFLYILLPKWPLATGDMNGWLRPNEVPDEFEKVNSWLEEQDGDFKVLWLPKYQGYDIDWYQGHKIVKDFAGLTSSKPTYVFWSPQKQPNGYGIYFFASTIYALHDDSILLRNGTDNFGKLLAPLGIKYIIFHNDNATSWDEYNRRKSNVLYNNLLYQEDLNFVKRFGFITVFENTYYVEQRSYHFYTTSNNYMVYGGLASFATLNSIPDFQSRENGLIFGNQRQYRKEDLKGLIDGLIFTRSGALDEIALNFADDKYLVAPFGFTKHNQPHEKWSGIKLNTFGNVQAQREGNLEEWDRDYDTGFVFTWSPGELKTEMKVNDGDLILNYDFETDIQDFKAPSSNLSLSLSKNSFSGNNSLQGIVAVSNIKGTHFAYGRSQPLAINKYIYRISCNLAGENVNNVQLKIVFLDKDRVALGRHYIMTESGTFNYTKFEKDVTFPPRTKYYSFQVIADQNTISDSSWWLDDLKIYDLSNYTTFTRFNMQFNVEKDDNYETFLRYLNTESGGRINIYLDGVQIKSIETLNRPNAFVWGKLASVYLKKGVHTIDIDNIVGFNAVNLIAVVPEKKMDEYYDIAGEFIEDKALIYTLEPETDFDIKNSTNINEYGSRASWAGLLRMGNNAEARFPIEILRAGNYTLALRLGGSGYYHFNASLGDNSHTVKETTNNDFIWYNISNIFVEEGQREILLSSISEQELAAHLSFENGWNNTSNAPEEWLSPLPQFDASLDSVNKTEGNNSLSLTTDATGSVWSRMNSRDIFLEPDNSYVATINVRSMNVNDIRASIHGYNGSSGNWSKLADLVNNINGTNDWSTFSRQFYVPKNTSKIVVALNAGSVLNASLGNATAWFDNLKISESKKTLTNELDMVVLYSSEEGKNLEEIFAPNQNSRIVSYKKIDSTKYEVRVSSDTPFMLAFAEAYDEFWVAYVNGLEIDSVPLYSMLNGFYITKTGNFTVVIEYKPQQWFNIGATITGMSIFGSLGYFIWVDRKMWGKKLNTLFKRMQDLMKSFQKKQK